MIDTLFLFWVLFFVIIAALEFLEQREEKWVRVRQSWPANLALIAMVTGISAAVPISGFAAAQWAQLNNYGLLNQFQLPLIVTVLSSLIILSLWDYLVHLASHKIPFLWRFHKIHHSDSSLDVTTTFRVHPLIYLMVAGANAVLIITLGLDMAAAMIYALVVLVIDIAHHTTLKLPSRLDRWLRPFLITPALHHIHHSSHVPETDSNYGHDIALWDRLFGTYRIATDQSGDEFRYGLNQYPAERADDLHVLLSVPFKKDPFA